MSFQVKSFVGNVTNVPEIKSIGAKGTHLLELNLAANARRKNKDTGEYEPVLDSSGKQKVSWLTVKLWGERADNADYVKGDLVEFVGSVQEEHYEKRDGSEGRRLETDFIESVEVKYPSKNRTEPVGATADAGFIPAPTSDEGDGW